MADVGGRSGGLGWFLVGLLVGVAGTLATQKVIQAGAEPSPAVAIAPISGAPAAASRPRLSDAPAATKPVVHKTSLATEADSSSAPHHRTTHEQSPADIADDAAAAGMTSRGTDPGNSGY